MSLDSKGNNKSFNSRHFLSIWKNSILEASRKFTKIDLCASMLQSNLGQKRPRRLSIILYHLAIILIQNSKTPMLTSLLLYWNLPLQQYMLLYALLHAKGAAAKKGKRDFPKRFKQFYTFNPSHIERNSPLISISEVCINQFWSNSSIYGNKLEFHCFRREV